MILGVDNGKLSKRHGAVEIREYRYMGYLPKALFGGRNPQLPAFLDSFSTTP